MSSSKQLVKFALPVTMVPVTLASMFTTGYVLSYSDLFNSSNSSSSSNSSGPVIPMDDTTGDQTTDNPRMKAEKFGFIIIFLLLLVFLLITPLSLFGRNKNNLFLIVIVICSLLAILTLITTIALTCYTIYLIVQAGVKKAFAITFLSFSLLFQIQSIVIIGAGTVFGVIQDRELIKGNISVVDRVYVQD